jgi:murein L,D-transpeptidase YafK
MKGLFGAMAAMLLIVTGLVIRDRSPLPPAGVADRIVVNKQERELLLLAGGETLKRYRVALGGHPRGHKTQQGDQRTPEGVYHIAARNPRSAYHRALRISYPNQRDQTQATRRGVSPGGDIMIHGLPNGLGWIGRFHRWLDWTAGCIAVTNSEIEEIWRAVPDGTPIEIKP